MRSFEELIPTKSTRTSDENKQKKSYSQTNTQYAQVQDPNCDAGHFKTQLEKVDVQYSLSKLQLYDKERRQRKYERSEPDCLVDDVKRTTLEPKALPDQALSESDYSTTTDELSEDSAFDKQRRLLVERVMQHFHVLFRAASPPRWTFCTRDSQSSTVDNINTSSGGQCLQASESSSSSAVVKRTSSNEQTSPSDNEDDDVGAKRPKYSKTSCDNIYKRKLACPFFKRNSERYLNRRSCVGPGWDEVRRVKEHLYRNHTLPLFCPRCYTLFKVETLLHDHQRATEPCEIRQRTIIEGFDKSQEKKLRSRKKSHHKISEEEAWKEMYRILFPDDDPITVPSPCKVTLTSSFKIRIADLPTDLDADWEKVYRKGKQPSSDELMKYEQYLRRELPSAVRRELERVVQDELTPLEERLKSQLVGIVRDVQLELFQAYTRSRAEETATAQRTAFSQPRNPTHEASPSNSSYSENVICSSGVAMNAAFASGDAGVEESLFREYGADAPSTGQPDGDMFPGLDAILFPFDDLDGFDGFDDSTYGSITTDSFFDGMRG
ncbi:hypothetical protein N0V90_006120 [Kalmusia sp. IMI 367209]|nr:hypothetical protein N0V90_006120 [Kalmusia sp. IMI 367209]